MEFEKPRPEVEDYHSVDPLETKDSQYEMALDFMIEMALIEHASRVNAGNNAVILELKLKHIGDEFRQFLEGKGLSPDDLSHKAVKMLKVYEPGRGRREFENHQAIWEAVEKKGDEYTGARVPRPVFFRDLRLSGPAQKGIEAFGLSARENVEVIMMDFVEGEDLATALFREVLACKRPDAYSNADELKGRSHESLLNEIQGLFAFERPAGKSRNEAERQFEARKVANRNASMLYTFLRKNGFVMHPDILKRLQEGVDAMHASGWHHRDLHERNVMVNGNIRADVDVNTTPSVHMIDFDTAVNARVVFGDVYQQGGRRYMQDETILRVLSPLTESLDDERKRIEKADKDAYTKRLERLAQGSAKEFIEQAVAYIENGDTQLRLTALYRQVTGPAKFEKFAAFLLAAKEKGAIDSNDISTFIASKREQAQGYRSQPLLPWERNGFAKIAKL
ncbi:MAG: phosphotransferase [bacterium]|nr:phosphotransferase [bacterium]